MRTVHDLATAVVLVAAILAIGSGLAKLASPRGAIVAMRAVGLPSGTAVVRTFALVELAVGTAVLVASSAVSMLLLVAVYGGLGAFSIAAIRVRSTAPCGCFGVAGGSISGRHLVLNATFAAAGLAVLLTGSSSLTRSVHVDTPSGVAVLAVATVTAALTAVVLSRTVEVR